MRAAGGAYRGEPRLALSAAFGPHKAALTSSKSDGLAIRSLPCIGPLLHHATTINRNGSRLALCESSVKRSRQRVSNFAPSRDWINRAGAAVCPVSVPQPALRWAVRRQGCGNETRRPHTARKHRFERLYYAFPGDPFGSFENRTQCGCVNRLRRRSPRRRSNRPPSYRRMSSS
jgi:hypothetical protein